MFSGATRPSVTPSAMNTRGRWSARLHPGRDDAGADRADAALEAVEREAGPGGLFPPVDEREGDDRAEDCGQGDGRIGHERDDRRGAAEDERHGERRAGQRDEGDDVPARADPEPEHPAAELADAGATVGEGRGDEGGDDERDRGQEDERGGAGQVEVDDPDAGVATGGGWRRWPRSPCRRSRGTCGWGDGGRRSAWLVFGPLDVWLRLG